MKITKTRLKQIIKEEIGNYYLTLEVPPDGRPTDDAAAIKKAYRKKAIENHPDRGGDQEKMKSVNVAGQTLLDKEKKKQYDAKLYADAVKVKKQEPNARFNGDNGLPLDDKTMSKLKDMAGIADQQQDAGTQDSTMDFMKLKTKILNGIHNRAMDAMKRGDMEAAQNFMNISKQLMTIKTMKKIQDYKIFAKFE